MFFGDSLSDTGNVLALTTAFLASPFPTFPGAEGRFSNGPVWTEYLAAGLGQASDAGPARLLFNGQNVQAIGAPSGNNYAFGGARTGLGGSAGATTGLFGQLVAWNGGAFGPSLTRQADPNALYVVLGGANDLRDARSANPGTTAAEADARQAAAAAVSDNVTGLVGLLAEAGARNFLVGNLPDLGKTPEAALLNGSTPGIQAASSDITQRFNIGLSARLAETEAFFATVRGVDLEILELDLYGQLEAVFAGPAAFGVTNTSSPCIDPVAPGAYFAPGSVDVNCSTSLYSDPLHPSALGHRLIGEAALRLVQSTQVPEPASAALTLLALAGLAATRRRQAALSKAV